MNFYESLFEKENQINVFDEAQRIKGGGRIAGAEDVTVDEAAIGAMGSTLEATSGFLVQAALIPIMELLVRGGEDEEELGILVEAIIQMHTMKHDGTPLEEMPQIYQAWKKYRDAYNFYVEAKTSIDDIETITESE